MSKIKILYYTGETAEKWSPSSIETGIGGSQTAVINLSQIWNSLGYEVTVCANIPCREILSHGVKYFNYKNFRNKEIYDIAILWREPSFLNLGIKAKKIFLDLHDVPQKQDYTEEVYTKIDKIFVKSEFHRSLFGQSKYKNFVVIPNGIDSALLKKNTANRNPYRLIYASDYYRGLEQMLLYGWPLIRKFIPEMSLDIYYGWNFFDLANQGKKERFRWKEKMSKLIKQPNVFEHGRIGQEKLTDEMLNSNILYYGCNFPEIDCIVARQAAAVGCIPFTSDVGVFQEKKYCIVSHGDFTKSRAHIKLAELIVQSILRKHIKNDLLDENLDQVRQRYSKIASKETWENTGKKWANFFC